MANIFASFANEAFQQRRDEICESAVNVGFDKINRWSPLDYKNSDFEARNKSILEAKRGAGYWLWKPWLILNEVRCLSEDDVLVYCDAGRSSYFNFRFLPEFLIKKVIEDEKGFLLGPTLPQHGPLLKWTKRDCIELVGLSCQNVIYRPQIQATWSIWRNTAPAIDFLSDWLRFCEDERCLTDKSNILGFDNYSDFVDHRHDQSILTLLAYRENAPYLDFSRSAAMKLLNIRSRSRFAHLFGKRILDAEICLRYGSMISLGYSINDILVMKTGY